MNSIHGKASKGVMDIEFIVAIVLFLTVLSFVSLTVIGVMPKLHQETFSQDIKSKAYQISEMLLFDTGIPTDWATPPKSINNVQRLGLSNGTQYFLSTAKMTELNTYCNNPNNYAGFKDLAGLDYVNDAILNITELGNPNNIKVYCKPKAVSQTRAKATITRFALDDSKNLLQIEVSVL
jgi:hypothetical protein